MPRSDFSEGPVKYSVSSVTTKTKTATSLTTKLMISLAILGATGGFLAVAPLPCADCRQPPSPPTYTITVAKSGTGSVTSNPSGINCGTSCIKSYVAGTQLTLMATAGSGQVFTGWTGNCTGLSLTCSLSITANKSVSATFAAPNITVQQFTPYTNYQSLGLGFTQDIISGTNNVIMMQNRNTVWEPLLFTSPDNGLSWQRVNSTLATPALPLPGSSAWKHVLRRKGLLVADSFSGSYLASNSIPNIYVSLNGGVTWRASQPINFPTITVAVTIDNNKVYVVGVRSTSPQVVAYSSTDGINWSSLSLNQPNVTFTWSYLAAEVYNNKLYILHSTIDEKPWLLIYDLGTGVLVQSANICNQTFTNYDYNGGHSLIVGADGIKALYTYFYPSYPEVYFAESQDDGNTWKTCTKTLDDYIFIHSPGILTQQGDRLSYFINNGFNANKVLVVHSLDGGVTWEKEVVYSATTTVVSIQNPQGWWNKELNWYLFVFSDDNNYNAIDGRDLVGATAVVRP